MPRRSICTWEPAGPARSPARSTASRGCYRFWRSPCRTDRHRRPRSAETHGRAEDAGAVDAPRAGGDAGGDLGGDMTGNLAETAVFEPVKGLAMQLRFPLVHDTRSPFAFRRHRCQRAGAAMSPLLTTADWQGLFVGRRLAI